MRSLQMKAIRNKVVSHIVASLLGALGMWMGKDLSMMQKPVEQAAEKAIDKVGEQVEKQVEKKLEVKLDKSTVDAGVVKVK